MSTTDNLAIIRHVMLEHHDIRAELKQVGESVNDIEAVFNLHNVLSGWSQSSMEALSEKQGHLQRTMDRLERGLKRHFDFEEETLPLLFGELLMRALVSEHEGIRDDINNAEVMIGVPLEELSQSELLSRKTAVQKTIDALSQRVDTHAAEEEVVLRMIQRELEAGGESKA